MWNRTDYHWLVGYARQCLVLVCLCALHSSDARAQFEESGVFVFRSGVTLSMSAESAPTMQSTAMEGATLQTVPEQELFKMRRAQEFANEGDFRSANALWQSVLDSAGSQLTTRDEWRYTANGREFVKFISVASEIETIFSKLSKQGLAAYQLKADGEARAILSNPESRQRTEVLGEVVRRYFLSAMGDEAAFELACIKLDRYEFNDASRLLRKCLEEHPQCTVPRSEILMRLAVANAKIDDLRSAEEYLRELSAINPKDDRIALIAEALRDDRSVGQLVLSQNDWPMKYGGPDRLGAMRKLPERTVSGELSEVWSRSFDVSDRPASNVNGMPIGMYALAGSAGYRMVGSFSVRSQSRNAITPDRKADRNHLLNQWKNNKWALTGGVLFQDGLLYYKQGDQVTCCSTDTGESKWKGGSEVFQFNPMMGLLNRSQLPVTKARPTSSSEVQLFGDQIYQSMAIDEGRLYCIEGPISSDPQPTAQAQKPMFNLPVPPRSQRNWLVAYDASNGERLWRTAGSGDRASDSNFDVGFTSSPVFGGGLAFVTVNDSGSISLVALNPENGSTVWKTYLCDEPVGRCSPWATTAIAYSGGDVYVGTGAGIVATVDSVSGTIRWVVRYPRSGKSSQIPSPFGVAVSMAELIGWREDVVVPLGRALIVMGTDSNAIFALDRRNGELLWDVSREINDFAAEYYLGTQQGHIFVAGQKIVRSLDVENGKTVWETKIADSFGAGIATEDALYLPSESNILSLSPDDGREISRASLVTTTNEPVGNLFSDGKRIVAVGLSRVYSLTDLQDRFHRLSDRVAKEDPDALIERSRLQLHRGNIELGCRDLETAYGILKSTTNVEERFNTAVRACETVLGVINDVQLSTIAPQFVLRMISRMADTIASPENAASSLASKTNTRDATMLAMRGLAYNTLNTVGAGNHPGLGSDVLAIASVLGEDDILASARRAIASTCSAGDLELLRTHLRHEKEAVRIVSIAGLARVTSADGYGPLLKPLMTSDPSDRVQLQCAILIANMNDRSSLSVFGKLLDSDDAKVRSVAAMALLAITQHSVESTGSLIVKDPKRTLEWQEWIAANSDTISMKLPFNETKIQVGRTLVCNMQANRVVEYDLSGKETWSVKFNLPSAVQGLSNGHRLVAILPEAKVVEYDAAGKEVWHLNTSGFPSRVCRLENGNTLVATTQPSMVFEYRPNGTVAWHYTPTGLLTDARRLENGNTLVAIQEGQVLEIDLSGKIVWSLDNLKGPSCVQPLENGNLLIALSGQNEVVELTRDNKQVWSKAGLAAVIDAQRLPNGNTLITDAIGVREFTPKGTTVDAHVPVSKTNNSTTFALPDGTVIRGSNVRDRINRTHRY